MDFIGKKKVRPTGAQQQSNQLCLQGRADVDENDDNSDRRIDIESLEDEEVSEIKSPQVNEFFDQNCKVFLYNKYEDFSKYQYDIDPKVKTFSNLIEVRNCTNR